MNDTIKRVRELDGKATPGPWKKKFFSDKWYDDKRRNVGIQSNRGDEIATVWRVSNTCIQGHQYKDADLIIEYRTLCPRLADELEAVEEELADLHDELMSDIYKIGNELADYSNQNKKLKQENERLRKVMDALLTLTKAARLVSWSGAGDNGKDFLVLRFEGDRVFEIPLPEGLSENEWSLIVDIGEVLEQLEG